LDEGADDIVAAGVDPVILWLGFRIGAELLAVAEHIPGAVYLCIAKAVAIVPVFQFLFMGRKLILP
jgi:hypothetical protein